MNTTVRCTSCNHWFRVPTAVIGQSVECPECHATFEAIAEDRGESMEETARQTTQRWPARDQESAEQEWQEGDYSEDFYRRRTRSDRVRGLVMGPGIALTVAGGLGLLYTIVNVVGILLGGARQL